MAVLVTRPHPDNEATAALLRAKGIEVLLAPMLRFEPVAMQDDGTVAYAGVIATSANALRAIDAHPAKARWLALPLFAVGAHTGEAARESGFHDIISGAGGAAALPDLIAAHLGRHAGKASGAHTLLYLAAAEIARDLSGELEARGFDVVKRTVYRMAPVAGLPDDIIAAFAAGRIEAILHYSRRSAQAFVGAARADGVEITALALPQCCLSDAVALALREAGAAHVTVARATDEPSMLDAVDRVLHPRR